MRFLCVSDYIDPLIYSQSVKERYNDVDAVLCAGDLPMDYVDFIVSTLSKPTYFVFGNHDLKEYKYYKKRSVFDASHIPFQYDMDGRGHGADYASNCCLRPKSLSFPLPGGKTTPLLICGVSGSIRYNNGQDQFTEKEMHMQLIKMIPSLLWNKFRYGRYCDIFLTHASPRHIHDKEDPCHKGFECFNWFIKKFKPALMVHGHIHLYDLHDIRRTESGETTVLNAYSHIIVDYNPEFTEKGELNGRNILVLSNR